MAANLGAYREDVQFNWTAAADLAAELRSTADALDGQVGERGRIGERARKQWEGAFALQFDGRVSICAGDAQRFIPAMRRAAGDLDELARLAREEQRRREQAREWAAQQERKNWLERNVVDRFFSESDVPPPLPPVDPPNIPVGEVTPPPREQAAGPGSGTGSRGPGRSSADPDDLDGWVTVSRALDERLTLRRAALARLQDEFSSKTRWGRFDASSMIGALRAYIEWNELDAQWVTAVAGAFRRADSSGGVVTLPDVVVQAGLKAAGLGARRQSVTFDDPIAWGSPPTTGYANDPVNTASGNFIEAEVDLVCGGLLRGLRFVRTFNSRSDRVGPFGRGWASWATARLRAEVGGAHWESPDGLRAGVGGAHWESPDGQRAAIPFTADGYRRVAGIHGLVVPGEVGLALAWFGGERWEFDADGLPLWIEHGPGTRVRFGHADGRLVWLAHEGGRRLIVDWDGDRIVALACSDGRGVAYRYDEDENLVEVDGPRGLRRYELDDVGRVVAVTDADGVVELVNTYDGDGRVVAQVSRHGRRTRMRYLPGGVTIVDDEDGGPVNTFVHDPASRLTGVIDGHGAELAKVYDEWGNPVAVTDRSGATTLSQWDDRARLVRRALPSGAVFTFSYDSADRVVEVTASTGAVTRYRYDGAERSPVEIFDPEGGVTRLEVSGGLARRIVDPDGVEVRFGFDADGAVISVTDSYGSTGLVERDAAGRVTAAVSPTGRRTELRYDEAGRPVERRDPGGGVWRLEYTAAGRLAAATDPAGARTEVRYGPNGEVEQVVDPLGYVTTRRFDPLGNLAGMVLPDGAKWAFTYDALCRLVGVHDPAGATWLREYDASGNLVGSVDPVGTRRTAEFDGLGQVRRAHDGFASVAFEYDELGRITVQRGADGTVWRVAYDRCGRRTSVTDPLGGVTRYAYTPGGRLAGVTSPMGHTVSFEYDLAGRLAAEVDPLGHRRTYSYDADGRVVGRAGPGGETWRFGYDEAGRLLERRRPGGGVTAYAYDAAGRMIGVDDPTGGVRRFGWDLRGQLVEAVDANGGATRYARNARGWLTQVTDPLGGVVERRYDEVGRLTAETDQLGRQTAWEYDPAGRLVVRTDAAGGQVRWRYDQSGRVTGFGTEAAEVTITRDLQGRPVAVDEPGLAHRLAWDALGRLVGKQRGDLALTWRYDADGRKVAVGYPDGTETVVAYDDAGRLVAAEHPALGRVRLDRDEAGRLIGLDSAGVSQRWRYRDGDLISFEVDRDGRRHVTDLTRDAAGRVVAETRDGLLTRRCRYDPAGQLVAVDTPDGARSFAYDPAGQLVAVDAPDGARSFAYDPAGRLVAVGAPGGTWSFAYDPAGRLVAVGAPGGTWSFAYDPAGRLVAETGPDGQVAYAYDAAHQLVARRRGGEVTRYGYDAAGRRVSETGPSGARTFTWDAFGRLSAIERAMSTTELTVDAFGDLASVDGAPLLWDPTGAVSQLRWLGGTAVIGDDVQSWATGAAWLDTDWQGSIGAAARDPWGAAGGLGPGLGWRGELEVDGLVWLRNRVYDPVTRAFLSRDPLPGVPGTACAANPYHYAANDPIGLLDPLGLRPLTDAELAAYRDAHSGTIASWTRDHWGELATAGLVVAGVAMIATGAGTAVGIGILSGVGSSFVVQHVITGDVDWGQVAASGFIGMVTGGAGAVVSNYSPVVSAGTQLVERGYPVIGGLTRYIAGGAVGGFTGGTLGEITDVAQGGSFDIPTVAGETIAGGAFGALGGSVPVGQKLFTGVVTDEAHAFNTITGITGGLWTETAKTRPRMASSRPCHGLPFPLPRQGSST